MNQFDEDGRKTGQWEEPDPHGGTVRGHYLAGERTGLWQHHFRDGALRSEFHYDHGELNGDCVWYRQTGGLLQKGGFLDGEKHGRWQRWTNTGAPLDEGTFERGVKSGPWITYSVDGSVKKTTNHRAQSRPLGTDGDQRRL
jgi:antitoxin component YwqK of YwqJK toxin-antitoxin module